MRLLSALTLCCVCSVAIADVPQTLRVDFYHSGNHAEEMFSLDRIVREPLPFPGNPEKPFDRTLRGKYEFQVRSVADDELLYSRSFSSIYGEWETTGEARHMNRTFHESLRFADPGEPAHVVLRKRGAGNEFTEVWRIEIDPEDFLVHEESAALAGEVVAIEHHGDPAKKVDLLLLGDGYTAAEHDAFIAKAREL
ncbi:MAG: peptidase M64 N-terminal domain-containing protein, partial [Woeseia sp.]